MPEARFIVGHGQMPEDHLEKVMQKFVGGEADVLAVYYHHRVGAGYTQREYDHHRPRR